MEYISQILPRFLDWDWMHHAQTCTHKCNHKTAHSMVMKLRHARTVTHAPAHTHTSTVMFKMHPVHGAPDPILQVRGPGSHSSHSCYTPSWQLSSAPGDHQIVYSPLSSLPAGAAAWLGISGKEVLQSHCLQHKCLQFTS